MNWLKIIQLVAKIASIAEDGQIDESEEDVIADAIAPELAKLYKKEVGPVEKWSVIRLLQKIALKTLEIINKDN